jgi:hypothetical protein
MKTQIIDRLSVACILLLIGYIMSSVRNVTTITGGPDSAWPFFVGLSFMFMGGCFIVAKIVQPGGESSRKLTPVPIPSKDENDS